MANANVIVKLTPKSEQVLCDLSEAGAIMRDLAEEIPWRDEPTRVMKLLERVKDGLKCEMMRGSRR